MDHGRRNGMAMVFGVAAAILGVNALFHTTWEWDAVVRGFQGEEIVQFGTGWYFASPHYVWLPLWQFLLAGLWFLTGEAWPAVKLGTVVSALSAGLLVFLVSRFAASRGWNGRVAVVGLLTSGTFIAYAGQNMTDVLSATLFFASVVCLLDYLETPSALSVVALAAATSLNMLLRYEAWVFAALMVLFLAGYALSRRSYRLATGSVAVAAPAIAVAGAWLFYNRMVSSSIVGFSGWIFTNNAHQALPWFLSAGGTAAQLLVVLVLGTGILWLCLFYACAALKEDWQRLFAILASVYLLSFAYSLYTGYGSGWPRQMLYLLPLSALSLASPRFSGRTRYAVLLVSAMVGVIAFASDAMLAAQYTGPCCP